MSLLVAATCLTATGVAAARGVCERGCSARIRILPDGHVTIWRSPQMFAPTDMIASVLTVHGQELIGEGLSYCHGRFYGQGIVADVSACGTGNVPLQIRASTVAEQAVVLRVTYRLVSSAHR
jgi:hypothetical protein